MRPILLILLLASMVLGQKSELGLPGVAPLKTSRKKFEKIYGPPVERNPENRIFKYRTETQLIEVTYTSKPCSSERLGAYRVRQDIVLDYSVSYLNPVKVSELSFDTNKFTMDDSGDLLNMFQYMNLDEGITIRVYTRVVEPGQYIQEIAYYPSLEQKRSQKCR